MLDVESELGKILPEFYKDFCLIFGSCQLGELFSIQCPTMLQVAATKGWQEATREGLYLLNPRMSSTDLKAEFKFINGLFWFGSDQGAYNAFFDLASYDGRDQSCDIYWISYSYEDNGELYNLGRDFFEIVDQYFLGDRFFDILPEHWFESDRTPFPRLVERW